MKKLCENCAHSVPGFSLLHCRYFDSPRSAVETCDVWTERNSWSLRLYGDDQNCGECNFPERECICHYFDSAD